MYRRIRQDGVLACRPNGVSGVSVPFFLDEDRYCFSIENFFIDSEIRTTAPGLADRHPTT
jgi:hypothetical protein